MEPKRPFFVVPGWWRSSSGLLLPSTIDRPPPQPAVRVPEELRPKPQPVAIGNFELSDLEQILVFVDEDVLGIRPSSLQDIHEAVGSMNFEAGMLALGHLAAKVFALRGRRDEQLRLARESFPSPFIERIEKFFHDHGNADLFAEQQVFILQRLLIEQAAKSVLPHELTLQERWHIAFGLAACGSLMESTSKMAVDRARTLEDLVAFFVQNGAYNTKRSPMGELARAREIYGRIAREPDLRHHDKYCSLDEWMIEDYGFNLEEQMTLGFALAAMTHAWKDEWEAGERCYIAPGSVDDLFVKLGWEKRKEQALSIIAADREQLQAEFRQLGDTTEHVVWETRPLMRRPFLRCESGALILLSPRAIQSWLTDGFHYRLLDSAQERSADDSKRRTSHRYTAYAGVFLERYVLGLLRSSYGKRPVGGGRVYGDQPYGRGDAAKTSDVALDLGFDLILIEVSGSRLRADALVVGSPETIEEDLDRMVVAKITQLDHCIDALVGGDAKIPAGEPEVDMSRVERIWPIVLTAGNIVQNDAIWRYIKRASEGLLTQAKVQPLTILDSEDFEQLCGLIEAGENLPRLLAGKAQEGFRERELAVWLEKDPQAPRERPPPQLVERAMGESVQKATELIDFTKGLSAGDS